ncbi:ParB/RepB/Spo0J family partition protein [Streptomyces longispororuber]|uniref:ParB/RepB/Spo0J family partition protein n=1 Tax=Streptomyces longispororuber TaxID=68230 RepID=UPI0033F4877E
MPQHKFAALKMRQIRRNPNQPREAFDEEALKELAASIKEHGLLQPVVVRKVAEGGYELVAGERRFRANEAAGNITIEAKILLGDGDNPIDDLTSFKKAMAENLNREDMLPLEEARGFKRVLDQEEDATPASVAAAFGKSTVYVTQRLALLNLRPEIAAAVNLGHIGTQAAVQIAALSKGNQKAVFENWKKGDTTDNQLVHVAYAMRKQEKAAQQDSMVQVAEASPEEKAQRSREQAKTRSDLDKIESIRELLDEISKSDPQELARSLQGQVGKRLEQMDRVAQSLQKARWQLRQAKAHADASEIMVNPDAAAPDLAGEAEEAMARLLPDAQTGQGPGDGSEPEAKGTAATDEEQTPTQHGESRSGADEPDADLTENEKQPQVPSDSDENTDQSSDTA